MQSCFIVLQNCITRHSNGKVYSLYFCYVHNYYVLDTQLNKVGSSSELIYFYKQQNIILGNYDKQGVLLF